MDALRRQEGTPARRALPCAAHLRVAAAPALASAPDSPSPSLPLIAPQVDVSDGRADNLKKNSFEMTGDKSDQDSWVKMAQNRAPALLRVSHALVLLPPAAHCNTGRGLLCVACGY